MILAIKCQECDKVYFWESKTDGLNKKYCTKCIKLRDKVQKARWRTQNKEKIKKSNSEYYKKNRDRIIDRNKKWVNENPEKVKIISNRYEKKRSEKRKEYKKKWRISNKKKICEQNRVWKNNNKDKVRTTNLRNGKKYRETLHDNYIKGLLVKRSSLVFSDIPPELIELKRLEIQLRREVRNL